MKKDATTTRSEDEQEAKTEMYLAISAFFKACTLLVNKATEAVEEEMERKR